MQVARGRVGDRPFARTVYTLGAKRFTGDFVLSAAGRTYKTSWEDGRVVAAHSPSPADTPGRLALAAGLVTGSTVSRVVEKLAAAPDADPIALLAGEAKLAPAQVVTLKRRVVAHAAARIFAFADAEFVADNARSLRADAEVPAIDPRWLIYFGVRTHYSVERLEAELAAVGDRALQLAADAAPSLRAFGFTERERPVLERLRGRALAIPELARATPQLDQHAVLALVYALVACDCLTIGGARPRAATSIPPQSPAASPAASATAPQPSGPARAASSAPARAAATRPTAPPKPRGPTAPPRQPRGSEPALARGTVRASGFVTPGARASGDETRALIAEKLAELDRDVDHYALLGVSQGAKDGDIRAAYFHLAKRLHPDRLRAVGVIDMERDAQRLFAAINTAFAVLSDPRQAAEYRKILAAGGAKAVARAEREAEEMAAKIFAAEEHFRIGEMALRRQQFESAERELARAIELNPDEGEYQAMWAWALWCNANDKGEVAGEVESSFREAIGKAPNSTNVHLHHGRLLKELGRESDALSAFRRVLELSPDNHEAELEVRVLSGRGRKTSAGGGLFGRKKR